MTTEVVTVTLDTRLKELAGLATIPNVSALPALVSERRVPAVASAGHAFVAFFPRRTPAAVRVSRPGALRMSRPSGGAGEPPQRRPRAVPVQREPTRLRIPAKAMSRTPRGPWPPGVPLFALPYASMT